MVQRKVSKKNNVESEEIISEEVQDKKSFHEQRKIEKKQLVWVVGWMIALVLIFILASWYFNNAKTIDYKGLSFTKEKFSGLEVYHYYYYFKDKSDNILKYNLYIRNNPFDLESIPVKGEIEFPQGRYVYIGVNSSGLTECQYSSAAIGTLSNFLTDNGFTVRGGTAEKNVSGEESFRFVSCESTPDNPTIIIKSGNETSITRKDNCYYVQANSCQILQVIEKFQVQSILDAKSRNETEPDGKISFLN